MYRYAAANFLFLGHMQCASGRQIQNVYLLAQICSKKEKIAKHEI